VSLREGWEDQAANWIAWARTPGHDVYWSFAGPRLFDILPPAGRLTVELGSGEGRVCRDLRAAGHRTIGVEVSPTLVRAAREADPGGEYLEADATAVPLPDGAADLVVAFNSLIDIDDMPAAVREAARLLEPGGRFCVCIPHPVLHGGEWEEGDDPDAAFVIAGSYLDERTGAFSFERDGLEITFHSVERPLESYSRALEDAGLLVEAIREPAFDGDVERRPSRARFRRLPMFLYLRAVKP
jgi:SAM-dependent methyltransferase